MKNLVLFFCLIVTCGSVPAWGQSSLRTARFGAAPGQSQAVMVDDVDLWHTAQIEPVVRLDDPLLKTPHGQAQSVLARLAYQLGGERVAFLNMVKLNVYVTSSESEQAVRACLKERFHPVVAPAVSFVQTRLRSEASLLAMDAVSIVTEDSEPIGRVARLPRGPRVYISGQAEKGMTLAEATTKTMQSLKATLQHLGCELTDVVQVKSFLTPMTEAATAEKAIADFFAPQPAPPCVFVEWQSSLPIEIELIAAVRPKSPSGKPQEPIEFITPPGMTASPVFCRVVRVNDPRTIFVSGLFAREAGDGAAQVGDVFAQLQDILKTSGSDLRHLAKATYYVTDNDASAKLNELRPKFYDPARPPAASKAQVLGVGMTGRTLTLDMIAIPAK